MEICVINLMRLGDLIQTTPVLRRLRARYPQARVTLVAMDLFAETASLLPEVDRLVTFPSGLLASALEPQQGWVKALKLLWEWRQDVLAPESNLAVNLTPNLLGGLVAHLAGARLVKGLAVGPDRQVFTRPAWTSYTLIVSRARVANPFNLVDLFLKGAGLEPDGQGLEVTVPAAVKEQAGVKVAALGLPRGTTLVGFIPGASRPERQWPTESWARLGRRLLESRPCHFIIFGTASERPLGEALLASLPQGSATLVMGGTTVPLLTAFLSHLHLLITNDTGPMHLAAAVGTPVLALFLASARIQDTGPVGAAQLMLEPRLDCHPCLTPCQHPRCAGLISPTLVARLAEARLDGKSPQAAAAGEGLTDARVYGSNTDPFGYHLPLPLVRRPLDRRHFWLLVHRLVWPELLDRQAVELQDRLEIWLEEVMHSHFLPPEEDLGLAAASQVFQEIAALARQGEEAARAILGLARDPSVQPVRLWQKTETFKHIDPALHRLALELPEAGSFIDFFFQEQRGSQNQTMLPLARELARAYRFLAFAGARSLEGAAALAGTLGLSRPLAEGTGKPESPGEDDLEREINLKSQPGLHEPRAQP